MEFNKVYMQMQFDEVSKTALKFRTQYSYSRRNERAA